MISIIIIRIWLHLQAATGDYCSTKWAIQGKSCRREDIVTAENERFEKKAVEKGEKLQLNLGESEKKL